MGMATKVRERAASVAARRRVGEDAFLKAYRALNAQQKKAVDTIEGPVMVLAGPGTGKTQVLALRVANILRQTQMDPWNILCLTFTESGVVAMRERLVQIIGPVAYRVRVHTFHGFCNALIQEFPETFTNGSRFDVLSDLERVQVWRAVLDELSGNSPLKPFGDPYFYLSHVIDRVRKLKQEDISPEQLEAHLDRVERLLGAVSPGLRTFFACKPSERSLQACEEVREIMLAEGQRLGLNPSWQGFVTSLFDRDLAEQTARTKLKNDVKRWFEGTGRHLPRQRELAHAYRRYQEELRTRGRYDYEDMVMQTVVKLKTDAELLAYCQEQFQYVMVDEYQDTNSAQNEFLQLLGSGKPFDFTQGKPNVFVVGDDKQSIFRFQGASLENLRFFYEWLKGEVHVISLTDNYRSQPTVLAAAGALIQHNHERVEKYIPGVTAMLSVAQERAPQSIAASIFATEAAERLGVARAVRALIDNGAAPEEIAVLYRYNRDASELARALESLGVAVQVTSDENILEEPAIHQLVRLLQYVSADGAAARSGAADEWLGEIIQYPFWALPALDVVQLLQHVGRTRQPLLSAMAATGVFAPLAEKLATWSVAKTAYTLQQWVDVVLNESGYLRWLLSQPNHMALVLKLNRLLDELKQANRARPNLTAREFLQQLELLRVHDIKLTVESGRIGGPRVRLMTAHKAKGLEFEHVFIVQVAARHWGDVSGRERLPLPHGLLRYDVVADPPAGGASEEDERRLFYVAMTRAKTGLHLSYARTNESGRAQVPAVFWHEIPRELVAETEVADGAEASAAQAVQALQRPLLGTHEEAVREWLREQLRHYVMSVTHLNNYLECPRIFYYRNLLRVPAAKTKSMAFGTAVHAALRDFLAAFSRRRTLPSENFLLDRFASHLAREVLTDQEQADSLVLGRAALSAYYQRYRDEFSSNALLEYSFREHGVELPVQSLRLTGTLDKVEIVDASRKLVNVVDYKTGNPDGAAAKLREGGAYRRQLAFYKLLTELSPRFEYEMVSGEIDFVQPSKRYNKLIKKQVVISKAEVSELQATIARVWQEIQDLRFLDPDVGCGECRYCRGL